MQDTLRSLCNSRRLPPNLPVCLLLYRQIQEDKSLLQGAHRELYGYDLAIDTIQVCLLLYRQIQEDKSLLQGAHRELYGYDLAIDTTQVCLLLYRQIQEDKSLLQGAHRELYGYDLAIDTTQVCLLLYRQIQEDKSLLQGAHRELYGYDLAIDTTQVCLLLYRQIQEDKSLLQGAHRELYGYDLAIDTTQVMFTACELGVFDLLLESEGPLSSDAIAERLGTSTSGMERLLDSCVGLKLLGVEIKSEGAFYRNTEISSLYLTKSSPKSQYHRFMYYSKNVYSCWNYLTDAVREGRNQNERAFGVSSKDFFGAFYRSEEEMIKFMNALNAFWSIHGKDVIAAFDLSPFTLIYDLGGGPGGLAQECISLYPNSTVTIYDLPKVVQMAKKFFVPPEEHQITFHEGDFFKDPIPEADLYILARVLHDWEDDKCMQLLAKVHMACKPGGGVLVVESLLNENKTGPLDAQLFSLILLVQTEGKERTPTEYNKLLTAAGFREIQVKKTGKFFDAILGRK